MDHRPFDVAHPCIIDHGHEHTGVLAYDVNHPAAVELVFLPEMISWIFARDLLFQAAIQGVSAGECDVVAYPRDRSHVVVRVTDYEGEKVVGHDDLVLDRRVAQKFLYATMDLVPLGEEDYSAQVEEFLHIMQRGRS